MKWVRRFAVLLLVCAPFALAAPPSSAQTTRTVTITPNAGIVGGDVVTLAGTGFFANSTVYFCEGIFTEPLSPSNCGVPYSTVSADETGAFSVSLTVYRFITPSGSGLIDCAQPAANCAFAASNLINVGPIELIGAVAPLNFSPQPPATLEVKGHVTGPDGTPLANAAVWAYNYRDYLANSWVGSIQTMTDATGAYDFPIEPALQYALQFVRPSGTDFVNEWWNDKTHRKGADFAYLAPPNYFNVMQSVTADAQLATGGAIAGRVTDTAGAGVPGTKVWAYGPGDYWVGSFGTTITAADGSYRINGVRPADYKVRFMPPTASGLPIEWYDNAALAADATSITVTEGSTTAGIDAQLSPSP